jgi:hypothetical protein
MKRVFTISLGIILFITHSRADEGMWLLPLIQRLNIDTMHSLGLKLSAEEIYGINHSSLKDAIVLFNGGCTAEIVSEKGLLLTNHHCGYDAIQNHSTIEHNYLEEGFWAGNLSEELPNPGMTVTFLIRLEDVTARVLASIPDTLDESKRKRIIAAVSDSIVQEATAGTHHDAIVESFFGGNTYYLCVYEDYTDVRLVGAPPSSIGKFGRDTDNWMWPRHTADFSIFRIYSASNGKPAVYSSENIPFKPRHALPVSLRGVGKGDFAMVIGYPGTTERYMTSYEVNELLSITNPNRVKIRGLRQEILLADMQADENVNIQYASKYSRSSNYWKYSIGQNQGLKRLGVLEKKQREETEFNQWVHEDPVRFRKYGQALNLLRQSVEGRASFQHTLQYTYECFFSASEILAFSNKATYLYVSLLREPDNRSLIDSLASNLKRQWENFYKEYNVATDRKVVPALLALYREHVPAEFLPAFYESVKAKYDNNLDAYASAMFASSIFADKQKTERFLQNPTAKALEKDLAFQAARAALEVYRAVYLKVAMFDDTYDRGHRLYIAGLFEKHKNRNYYPDANSTMRLSYGTVQDYYPRDAVHYDYLTTLDGVMEKEDPDSWEFRVPEKLKTLYRNKDFGSYGLNGKMPACFITTNDITGGNSGSPVLDGEGNLLGLAFDGNWEAMSGNVAYEPELQRCICVDIRYVLFVIDKYAGATHLIDEMKLIR